MQIAQRVHPLFKERLTAENGLWVDASVQRASDNDEPAMDFTLPRLLLKVPHDSLIKSGEVVQRLDGSYLLLAENSRTPWYISLWGFTANRQVLWGRQKTVLEPVTGLQRSAEMVPNGEHWVAWEMISREPVDRAMKISDEINRVLTNQPVALGDQLAGQTVRRLVKTLGLNIAWVQ